MKPAPSWHARARELSAKGMSHATIAERMGKHPNSIACALDDAVRARYAERAAVRDAAIRAARKLGSATA